MGLSSRSSRMERARGETLGASSDIFDMEYTYLGIRSQILDREELNRLDWLYFDFDLA